MGRFLPFSISLYSPSDFSKTLAEARGSSTALTTVVVLAGPILEHMPATTTCDACGRRYPFTSYKDRCPVCCPGQSRDDDAPDNQEQADWDNGDDD
jgi:hypothetical protein